MALEFIPDVLLYAAQTAVALTGDNKAQVIQACEAAEVAVTPPDTGLALEELKYRAAALKAVLQAS